MPCDGGRALSPHPGPLPLGTAIELSPAAGPHWQALNLNLNRNLARLRFLEIKSKITIKIGKKPFRLKFNGSAPIGRGRIVYHLGAHSERFDMSQRGAGNRNIGMSERSKAVPSP